MAGARVTEPRVVGEHARRHRVVFSAALTASRLWAPVSWPVAAITRPVNETAWSALVGMRKRECREAAKAELAAE